MKHIPPKNAEIDLYIVYSADGNGRYIEGVFTHKPQAEAYMRYLQEDSRDRHWIGERTTQPHGEGQ